MAENPKQIKSRAKLIVRIFGQMEVFVDGEPVAMPSRKASWLLAILALRHGQPIERGILAAMLWPDSTHEAELHNLRQTLAALRRALGTAKDLVGALTPRSVLLRVSPEVSVDVLEFHSAIGEGSLDSLERALELYRGPFLAGCEEPFAIEERGVQERAFVAAAERLGKHYASLNDHSRSAQVLRRALMADPYCESACRSLMSSLAESGEAAMALEIYRNLRERLRNDLKFEPDHETKTLYRSIRNRLTKPDVKKPEVVTSRIPGPLSALIGRSLEISEVASLMERCRLITLTGIGGVGKTRLSIAVAQTVGDRYLDGGYFVDLAPLQDPATIPTAIAAALEIQERAGEPLLLTIAENLRHREILVIFDNCEHLTQDVAQIVDRLLSASQGLHVLATSRQSLGVGGEFLWPVPPLAMPQPSSDDLLGFESVRLFVERAGHLDGHWKPSASELSAIGSICRKLEGIPLAIELAAARMKVLSASEIDVRLEDRFAVLASGNRTTARHQTLHAAIEWSWDLLSTAERELLMALSVFRGGCTLDAIESVAQFEGEQLSALDLIASLVDRSLVVSNKVGSGSRYTMLETVRQFSAEKMLKSVDQDVAHDRHLEFYVELALEAGGHFHASDEAKWFEILETEHDNIRAALKWCQDSAYYEKGLLLANRMSRFWDTCGHLGEGRGYLETFLALVPPDTDRSLLIGGHIHSGWMATVQRDIQGARLHYQLALPFAREFGDEIGIAKALTCFGQASYYAGDCDKAQELYEEALGIYRRFGHATSIATVLDNLGELALFNGQNEVARTYLEQSIEEGGGINFGNPERRALSLANLSLTDLRQGRFEEAREHALHSLRLFHEASVVVSLPGALDLLGIVAASYKEFDRAARLLGAAMRLADAQGVPLSGLLSREREGAKAEAIRALGADGFETAFSLGGTFAMAEAVAFALT